MSSQNSGASSPTSINIDHALLNRKVIITCGTGGVGKTTLSAALALRSAMLGRKTCVITIDPAKRLVTSLGMKSLGDEPTDLTPQLKAAFEKMRDALPSVNGAEGADSPLRGLPRELTGSVAAIMPDTRKTFESFIHYLSRSSPIASKVMNNPIFEIFAREFSGTNEYMALERLYDLYRHGGYDCIILDTPPSRNTLAFLNAPHLLARFFEEKLIRWLALPANQLVSIGMKKALGILERLTGEGFMGHLVDFASSLLEVQAAFTTNLKKVMALLSSEDVGFMMVTTPAPDTIQEAQHFIQILQENQYHFDGVALNRLVMDIPTELKTDSPLSDLKVTPEALNLVHLLQARQKKVIDSIQSLKDRPIPICARLPELARDVHSIEDLFHVALAFRSDSTSA